MTLDVFITCSAQDIPYGLRTSVAPAVNGFRTLEPSYPVLQRKSMTPR